MTLKKIRHHTMQSIIYKKEHEVEYMCVSVGDKHIGISYKVDSEITYCVSTVKELNSIDKEDYRLILCNFFLNYPEKKLICFDKWELIKFFKMIDVEFDVCITHSLKTMIRFAVCPFELPYSISEFNQTYIYRKYYDSKFKGSIYDSIIGLTLLSNKFLNIIKAKQIEDVIAMENNVENDIIRIRKGGIPLDVNYIKESHKRLVQAIMGVREALGNDIIGLDMQNKKHIQSLLYKNFDLLLNEECYIDDELYDLGYKATGNQELSLFCKQLLFLKQAEYIYKKYIKNIVNTAIENNEPLIDIKITQNLLGVLKSSIGIIDNIVFTDLNDNELIDTAKLIERTDSEKICYEYEELELRVILELCMKHLEKEKIPAILKDIYLEKDMSAFSFLKSYSIGDTTNKDNEFLDYVVKYVISSFTYGASLFMLYKRRDIYEKLGVNVVNKLYKDFQDTLGDINNLKDFIVENAMYYGMLVSPFGKKFYFPAEYNLKSNTIPRIFITSICTDIVKDRINKANYFLEKNDFKSRIIAVDGYKIYVERYKKENIRQRLDTLFKKVPFLSKVPAKINITENYDIVKLNEKERFN